MWSSTQAMSAQVTSGLQSLRGSVGTSTGEAASRHSPLRETLASFGLPASTTTQRLYNLLSELDQECLRHATNIALDPAQDSTSEVGSVAELALFLSGSLNQYGYPGRSLFQEIQLRSLIASLALLQYNGVNTLNPDVHDRLRLKNISARFQNIVFQRHSTLAERVRATPNTYLIHLASQYASFIKRDDSPWPSIFAPTMNIVFSALALGGGQYNHIRDIFGGLHQIINIWQRPQTKYQTLCALQEYTRLATSLCREAVIADESIESGELRTTAAAIVTTLVDKLDEILAAENLRFPPELARRWHRWLALISRGPPDLDQGYAYYGYLDCLSQLAAVSDPQMLEEGLQKRVNNLIFDSVVPEYRWKAIEIVLSCHCTRPQQYQMLERDVRRGVPIETEANVLEEMRVIKAQLDSDEEENLRFVISRPLPRISDSGSPTIPLEPGGPPTETLDVPTPENTLGRSRTKSSTTFSLSSVRKFNKSYHFAGLFNHGRFAFFNNDSEISVYKLGDLPERPDFSKVFTQEYKRKAKEFIQTVASCNSHIMVATNKRLLVFRIDPEKLIGATSHGDWDPSGLTCHESETHVIGFLGQCQRNASNKYNGQIRVVRYKKHNQSEGLPVFALNVPANDSPKRLFFDADSQILTCITRTQNNLLVWKLDDDFFSPLEPLGFLKNNYRAETGETGVTSATIYRSPSNKTYVLCTTAPSTERWHHDGEWSFILPILGVPENVSRSQILLSSKVHNFNQLQDHRSLFAGCPSCQHHIFAVLENSGRLSVLRLERHDDGGIHSADSAEFLVHSLCKQDRPMPDCLCFDPTGSHLFAVDPKGKIIVTVFEKE